MEDRIVLRAWTLGLVLAVAASPARADTFIETFDGVVLDGALTAGPSASAC